VIGSADPIRGKLSKLILGVRNRHFLTLDVLALLFIPALALTLRLDRLNWFSTCGRALALFVLVSLVVKVAIFYYIGLYRCYWRYADVNDLMLMPVAVSLSTGVLTAFYVGAHAILKQYELAMYRTVPLIDGALTGLVVGGSRSSLRVLYYWCHCRRNVRGGRRVLIVGAGESGAMVAHEMWANPQLNVEPVAFVDDDPVKDSVRVQGLPVVGTCAQIPELVGHYDIQRIVVALPSVPLPRRREIVALCESTGVDTYSLPGMYELLAGYKTVSYVPEVDVQRLLRRALIEIDHREVGAALRDATVLVTGAGGSIGSELCRQIARYDPAEIILLGHGENSIFEITLDLRLSFPHLVTVPAIVDVRDRARVDCVVKNHRPAVIFHAAAHKHVPFMEECVDEALTNNVLGTWNVLRAAERHGVEGFVLISTDKAVYPTSVMGATKRLAELLTVASARRSGRPYLVVRFGNVLGSRGSVIPIFQQQIAAGGPVTITHPDMRRYFMSIPEAVALVLHAFRMDRGGEIFVLDMGKPVRILDLAIGLIKLSGLEPGRDIEIAYTNIRPGEKLSEELFLDGEERQRTKHPKIIAATDGSVVEVEVLELLVMELVNLARRMNTQDISGWMQALLLQVCRYIDDYRPMPESLLPKLTGTPEVSGIGRRFAPSTSTMWD